MKKARWAEMAFWMAIAILTGGMMIAVVCCAAWLALRCDPELNGTCQVILAVASLIVFVTAWVFNGISWQNYRTCRRIIEMYSYKEWLLCRLGGLQAKCTVIVNQSVLVSGENPDKSPDKTTSIRKPVIAMRTDYKLFEMLIESLADDPSKRMFA